MQQQSSRKDYAKRFSIRSDGTTIPLCPSSPISPLDLAVDLSPKAILPRTIKIHEIRCQH